LRSSRTLPGQPVEQVGAEGGVVHRPLQVAVGGGDDPHVDPPVRRLAQALDLPRLQRAQQARLHGQVQLADLVEEDGPAVGLLEGAGPIAGDARERPARAAVELALDQRSERGC
jgi:hypothetical protein